MKHQDKSGQDKRVPKPFEITKFNLISYTEIEKYGGEINARIFG